nr:dehydrogenase/reductase SDR family member 12-like [Oncorhynchus nerka]
MKAPKSLSEVGFEPTPPFGDQNALSRKDFHLESGALDRSAILTTLSRYKKKEPFFISEAATKHFNRGDLDVNLSGRSFVVTGANSAVGKATAHEIAKIGGTVHLVCRNKGRAEEAKEVIVEQSKNQNVHVHIVGMSSARQVWEFAERFAKSNIVHLLLSICWVEVSLQALHMCQPVEAPQRRKRRTILISE